MTDDKSLDTISKKDAAPIRLEFDPHQTPIFPTPDIDMSIKFAVDRSLADPWRM